MESKGLLPRSNTAQHFSLSWALRIRSNTAQHFSLSWALKIRSNTAQHFSLSWALTIRSKPSQSIISKIHYNITLPSMPRTTSKWTTTNTILPSAPSMHVCDYYGSQNKQWLYSCRQDHWLVFITERESVYCAVRAGSYNPTHLISRFACLSRRESECSK